jgi:purine-binding chemotaxis protein CheW
VVDLAKIRKKARKQGAGDRAQGAEEPPAEAGTYGVPPAEERTAGVPPADTQASRLRGSGEKAAETTAPTPLQIDKLARFKEQAGQRRVTRVEQVVEAKAQLELLTFLIAGEQYAIDIEKIVEIVTPRSITRIPNADASVVGITSLRGTIVTLVDVRRKLRHPAIGQNETSRIVVIDRKNETVGFVVDRVLRVVKIAPTEVEPHPVVHTTELVEAIRGVFRVGGALTILLDLDKLLDHSQWT